MQTDILRFERNDLTITFVAAWFGSSIFTLSFAFLLLVYLSTTYQLNQKVTSFQNYAALPSHNIEFTDSIQFTDARAKIVENFFKGYKAPLAEQAEAFVKAADKYGFDYRWLPAIAMQESNGGKKIIPSSKNPFGYGIYGGKVTKFTTFEEAIDRVARGLKEDYFDQGLNTPEAVMAKYTPPSVGKGGPWAKGVRQFMSEMN